MSKKNKKGNNENSPKRKLLGELRSETKYSIFAIGAFVLGLIFILSYFDKAGVAGTIINKVFGSLFGNGYLLAPFLSFLPLFLFSVPLNPTSSLTPLLARYSF